MKKFLAIVLTFVLCFGVLSVALAAEDDAVTAVPDGYIGIYTAEDLDNIRNNLSGKYILMNNIDLSSYENWSPIGTSETPFTGELDGNGYSVENMTITAVQEEQLNAGLFGYVKNSTIKNLTIDNGKIDVSADKGVNTGLVCAEAEGSVILNCKTYGSVDAKTQNTIFTGGILGVAKKQDSLTTIIERCSNFANVCAYGKCITDDQFIFSFATGGIVGFSEADIVECSNHGNINSTADKTDNSYYYITSTGGICGDLYGKAENCYNVGSINTQGSQTAISGGIAGHRMPYNDVLCVHNIGIITTSSDSSYNYSSDCVGAIIGFNDMFMYPSISGIEEMPTRIIKNAYYLNNVYNAFYETGSDIRENIKMMSSEEFKKQESFVGFDFDNIWVMDEKKGYPVFKWECEKESSEPSTDETTTETTAPVTEPSTEENTTVPVATPIEPSTTQPTTATTEPVTEPTTAEVVTTVKPTEPVTNPVTEPSTAEVTTQPVTEPTTQPLTEIEPTTTEPVTEPSTTTTTEPSAATTTEPTTEPSTEPDEDICVLAWLIKVIKAIIDFVVRIFVMLGC